MRQQPTSNDVNGEALVLQSLRILQDCPAYAIVLRKVLHPKAITVGNVLTILQELLVVFRHLMSTPHRRALIPHIEKLFDEKVLLGSAVSSQEILRCVHLTLPLLS